MQKLLSALFASLLWAGCAPPNVQQHAGFRRARLTPDGVERPVGELVRFSVLPPVAKGTKWSLESHGLARFVGDDTGRVDWVADTAPIRMEAMVAPWGPDKDAPSSRSWLWFGMGDGAETEPLALALPVHPLPYHEIAAVTYTSSFSLAPRETRLSYERSADRVKLRYLTPIGNGVPYAPRIGAVLVETAGKRVLYAEIKTNFGERTREQVGYEVTLSYSATVKDPVEVVVVEWTGYGLYYGPFDVHRLKVGEPGSAERETAGKTPSEAKPVTEAAPAPPATETPALPAAPPPAAPPSAAPPSAAPAPSAASPSPAPPPTKRAP